MEVTIVNKRIHGLCMRVIFVLLLGFILSQCMQEPMELPKKPSDLVMTEYVYNNPDEFSEFGNILKVTGVENILRVRGPYTLFLPTNDAMKAFYAKNGKSSYKEFEVATLKNLAYNHILKGEVSAGTMGPGVLPYQNALNDNVASDLQGVDIVLNKQAKIIKRDIKVSNGTIHHIDSVLDLVTRTVYEVLSDDGGYTIFKEGLDLCGLTDTLNFITIPYGNINPRVFYTLLTVPDTLYHREGINNINDLIAKYDTLNDGNYKSNENLFYQYMENHCLAGSHFFTDFNNQITIYYIMTQNSYIQIIDEDLVFKINKQKDGTYSEFYYAQSNVPAKNGCLHTVNNQLPVTNTQPIEVLFQVTDHFDMQQGPYYHKYYERFYDGQNDFKDIKWDGDYLLYYYPGGTFFMDGDGLDIVSNGYFWIEITTPKIRKGNYKLSSFHFGGDSSPCYNVYVDGEFQAVIPSPWGSLTNICNVKFTETKQHKIKFEAAKSTSIFWDYVKFTPN